MIKFWGPYDDMCDSDEKDGQEEEDEHVYHELEVIFFELSKKFTTELSVPFFLKISQYRCELWAMTLQDIWKA